MWFGRPFPGDTLYYYSQASSRDGMKRGREWMHRRVPQRPRSRHKLKQCRFGTLVSQLPRLKQVLVDACTISIRIPTQKKQMVHRRFQCMGSISRICAAPVRKMKRKRKIGKFLLIDVIRKGGGICPRVIVMEAVTLMPPIRWHVGPPAAVGAFLWNTR